MKNRLRRHWIVLWWLVSVGIAVGIGCLGRLVVKQPPFTDWPYIIGMAIAMPSFLLPVFLYMLRKGQGWK